MLDKITNNNSESIAQSQSLDRIKNVATNPFEDVENGFFIDESNISSAAIQKYEREVDIKKFSEILKETDEKASNELVLQQAFEGNLSIENDDFISELLNNKDFLNDIS